MSNPKINFQTAQRYRSKTIVLQINALVSDVLVGYVEIEFDGSTTVYLENIEVAPGSRWHAQKGGVRISDVLLQEAWAEAKRRGCDQVECDVIAYERDPQGNPGPPPPGAQARLEDWYQDRGFTKVLHIPRRWRKSL